MPCDSRLSPRVLPVRPAATSTAWTSSSFPDASERRTFFWPTSTAFTESGMAKLTPSSFIRATSASTISLSRNVSIRSRCSTRVTGMPSAANMQAYSQPMTPPPMTASEVGTSCMSSSSSESCTRSSSNG